ncbi:MAG: DEAD/DEAH box helicase family protein, partial [Fibrobacterales bacterium]
MLAPGIYETLITHSIAKKLQSTECDTYYKDQKPVDKSQAVTILSNHIIKVLHLALKVQQENGSDIEHQITFCNDLIQYVDQKLSLDVADEMKIQESNILYALLNKLGKTDLQLKAEVQRKLPQTGLTTSTLFTGSNSDISIDTEIERDMLSANRIYLIVSFIRWSGLVIFEKILREISHRDDVEIRIITTTYMGATEARALDFLSRLPNTKIKISYNTTHERLHAKSYIFERDTEYDTAYIGSSNMSRSALTKGLEWNLRVTSQENLHIIEKAKATFDHYWNSNEFEDFELGGIERFKKALSAEKVRSEFNGLAVKDHERNYYLQIAPYPFQKEVLEKMSVERTEHDHFRNLVVSATGTGKTVISAFDYKRYRKENTGKAKLLFIAHRAEILKQARGTFRSVLGVEHSDFGQLWVGGSQPNKGDLDHLFISVQTFDSQKEFFEQNVGYDYYDYIIVDEAHHATAKTYRTILERWTRTILLGLGARPERMDGRSLLPDFCNKIAAEIRLP